MNYRHSFHAGNHADVLKHAVLLRMLTLMQRRSRRCALTVMPVLRCMICWVGIPAVPGVPRWDRAALEPMICRPCWPTTGCGGAA